MSISSHLLVAAYLLMLVVIAAYGFHRYILLYLYIKHRHNSTS